jgi:hypothetical protein
MTVDWGDYGLYVPPVVGPPRELSRQDARLCFKDIMSRRQERDHELGGLLRRNGLELATDRDALVAIGTWYVRSVEQNPERPERLWGNWYSVGFDLDFFVGDLVLARHTALKWHLVTGGKRNVAYHKPVIAGFRDPRAEFIVDGYSAMIGHRAIAQLTLPEEPLWEVVESADSWVQRIGLPLDS